MYSKYSLKFVFLALFYLFIVLIIATLLIQIAKAESPCTLCILQRYMLIFGAAASLFGALHDSRGFMRRIYAGISWLASSCGLIAAVYQVWLQSHGQDRHIPQLQDWLNAIPLSHVIPGLFRGSGNYAGSTDLLFLGWSMAHWVTICFLLLCLLSGWQTLRITPERRRFS